jgi:hypothetical protein
MECRDVDRQIDAYLDRELSLDEARLVEAHLEGCAACRRKYGGLMTLLRSPEPAGVPAGLHGRIMTELARQAAVIPHESSEDRTHRRGTGWTPWAGAVAASLMFFVLGWFGSQLWVKPSKPPVRKVEPPQQVTVVVSPWLLSGWAQAMALRSPAGPAFVVAQDAGMELLTARLFEPPPVRTRQRPTTRPLPRSEPPDGAELIPILPPVLPL